MNDSFHYHHIAVIAKKIEKQRQSRASRMFTLSLSLPSLHFDKEKIDEAALSPLVERVVSYTL